MRKIVRMMVKENAISGSAFLSIRALPSMQMLKKTVIPNTKRCPEIRGISITAAR